MFKRNSIKFKLIFVISVATTLIIALLMLLQVINSSFLEEKIEKNSLDTMDEIVERHYINEITQFESHLLFDIQTMAIVLNHDLYNLDKEEIDNKLKRYSSHIGVCAIYIMNNIDESVLSSVENNIKYPNCKKIEIPISYKDEAIGSIKVFYSTIPIDERAKENRYFLEQTYAGVFISAFL